VLDAAAILVNLIWAGDQPELYHQCVSNVAKLKMQCERLGMPLMVEALLMRADGANGGYRTDGKDVTRSVSLVRQAVELGADVIKTDPPDDLDQFSRILQAAGEKPLLVRGGSLVSDSELLARTFAIMQAGAAGIVYGRNIYQRPNLEDMLRACNSIVHAGAGIAEAESFLQARV
jgi:DhnA family fructose-bisphosphate aldolase class Ia